jgi:RNA ligase
MKLYDLLDRDLLKSHIENRLVSVQKHPTLPLRIFNYSHLAQYDLKVWDNTISYCRGLIVDDRDVVFSRPFRKFFNLNTLGMPETSEENLPDTEPLITTKMDGSLGIYWYYDGQEGIATRGSFISPQAIWATKYYHEYKKIRKGDGYGGNVEWPIESTPLFEIIYNENRIVVQYDFEGLVLLGIVDNEKGFEWDYKSVLKVGEFNNYQVVQQKTGASIHQLKSENVENEEGFVLTYFKQDGPPLKVKIKMEDYVRLHKIVTGMNARSVWERLSSGEGVDSLDSMPEHFKKWLFQWRDKLVLKYENIWQRAVDAFMMRPTRYSNLEDREYRKQYAQYVITLPEDLRSVMFALIDDKDPSPLIWKQIKPRGDDQSFRTEGE